jgi:hypothetical protein
LANYNAPPLARGLHISKTIAGAAGKKASVWGRRKRQATGFQFERDLDQVAFAHPLSGGQAWGKAGSP